MKKHLLRLRILFAGVLISFMFVSCFVCKECTVYDSDGNPFGIQKLCGEDLKKAEKDSVHYKG